MYENPHFEFRPGHFSMPPPGEAAEKYNIDAQLQLHQKLF